MSDRTVYLLNLLRNIARANASKILSRRLRNQISSSIERSIFPAGLLASGLILQSPSPPRFCDPNCIQNKIEIEIEIGVEIARETER